MDLKLFGSLNYEWSIKNLYFSEVWGSRFLTEILGYFEVCLSNHGFSKYIQMEIEIKLNIPHYLNNEWKNYSLKAKKMHYYLKYLPLFVACWRDTIFKFYFIGYTHAG